MQTWRIYTASPDGLWSLVGPADDEAEARALFGDAAARVERGELGRAVAYCAGLPVLDTAWPGPRFERV